MARIATDDHSSAAGDQGIGHSTLVNSVDTAQNIVISPMGLSEVPVPGHGFVSSAIMTQEGSDLILETPDGVTMVIEGYFSSDTPPNLISTDGKVMTPELVKSFIQASTDFAEEKTAMNDSTPVGQIDEVTGSATITHLDGTKESIVKGTPVHEGDVIETDAQGAVNVKFADESSFAVSNNAKMAIDEFVFDTQTNGGENKFSVLRGLFVYTSGLVGREDPDDVKINTPVGSIGIRGTIITGDIPADGDNRPAAISVVEGAIVVNSVTGTEMVLTQQFETVQINTQSGTTENIGVLPQSQMSETFNVLRTVAPTLFSSIEDGAPQPQGEPQPGEPGVDQPTLDAQPGDVPPAEMQEQQPAEPPQMPPPNGDMRLNLMQDRLDPGLDDKIRILADGGTLDLMMMPPPGMMPPPPGMMPPPPGMMPPPPPPPGSLFDPSQSGSFGGNNPPTSNVSPVVLSSNYQSAEQGAVVGETVSFDISRFFRDANGDPLTYTVTATDQPNAVTASVDANGILHVGLTSIGATSLSLGLQVTASDGQSTSAPLTIQITGYTPTSGKIGTAGVDTLTATANGQIMTGRGGDDILDTYVFNNITAFGGDGDDTLSTDTSNNKLYGGEGTDTLEISGGTGNLISGGGGNDSLAISLASPGATFSAFGGTGSDVFVINNTQAANALLGAGSSMIDGGTGFDVLYFSSGIASINLANFDAGKIMDIEKIQVASSTSITLDIADIFRFGGEDKSLFIEGTAGTNVTVLMASGGVALSDMHTAHSDPVSGTTYDVYSNGNITLYVSDNVASVSGTGIV